MREGTLAVNIEFEGMYVIMRDRWPRGSMTDNMRRTNRGANTLYAYSIVHPRLFLFFKNLNSFLRVWRIVVVPLGIWYGGPGRKAQIFDPPSIRDHMA